MRKRRENRVLADRIALAIGEDKVKDDESILVTYGFDSSIFTPYHKPSLVVLPMTTDEVRKVLVLANQEAVPVTVMSGGVNVGGMCVPSEGVIVLDLRNMNRIVDINTDAAYAIIEPGVNFDQLTGALHKVGFRCHVPTAPGGATPLGNYLLQPSGSLANRHYDSLIAMEVVLPDGLVFHTGSAAYQSDNAKYYRRYGPFPDLSGLLCCAYGTLGIITKASIRIYPKNEANRVNLAGFRDYASATKFVKDIVGANIPEHCVIWNWHFYKTYDISLENPESPYIPPELYLDPSKPPEGVPYNIVTTLMSGYTEVMDASEKACRKVAEKYGGRPISWNELEEISPGSARSWKEFYLEYHQPKMEHNKKYGLGRYSAWIGVAEPADIAEVEEYALNTLKKLGNDVRPICYYSQPFDFGRCMFFRMFVYTEPRNQELHIKIRSTFTEMYNTIMQKYGATPERFRRDPEMTRQLDGYYEVLKRIKRAVDPNNILNPSMNLF